MTPALRDAYDKQLSLMASNALRCLAFAWKQMDGPLRDYDGPKHPAHKWVRGLVAT